jgi:hypothetical protein
MDRAAHSRDGREASHGRLPDAALNALQRAVAGATCWEGCRGEAAEMTESLLREVTAAEVGDLAANRDLLVA